MPDVSLLVDLMHKFAWLGNWFFLLLAFIESAPFVGMLIPGATLISVGGFLAAQGLLNAWDIIIFATIGAILGDFFSYSLGRWGGDWIYKHKIVNQKMLDHGEEFFRSHGSKSIFFGRFFGPVRAIVPFIAGMSRMKQRDFVFWNVLSAIGWAFLNVFAGYFSGTVFAYIVKKWSDRLTIILLVILLISLVYWLIKKNDKSIARGFKSASIKFNTALNTYSWFIKLRSKYIFIQDFYKENKRVEEKIFGGVLISTTLIILYIITLILDVF